MAQKKYITLSKLGTFLTSLRSTFAPLSHTHKMSDISDYESSGYVKKNVTLSKNGWSETFPYEISVSITELSPKSDVQVLPNYDWSDDEAQTWRELQLMSGVTGNGTLSLKAYGEKPTIDLPITLLIGTDTI